MIRCLTIIQIELEFVGFCGQGKTGVPGEKPSEKGREKTTNSMTPGAGIEPGTL